MARPPLSASHKTSLTGQLITLWHRAVSLLSLRKQAEPYTLPALRDVSMRLGASVAKANPDVVFDTTKYYVDIDGNVVKKKRVNTSVRF